jgi:DNA mismatch repair protein MSH4
MTASDRTSTWTEKRDVKFRGTTERNFEHEIVAAIITNKGFEAGIAWCDLQTLSFKLTEIVDTPNFTKTLSYLASVLQPEEVCLPSTSADSHLTEVLRNFEGLKSTLLQRRFFNDTHGAQLVQELSVKFTGGEAEPETLRAGRYLALGALAALIQYVEFTHRMTFAQNSLRIHFQSLANYVETDTETLIGLSILPLAHAAGEKTNRQRSTLLDTVNFTKTFAGKRLLRGTLLQPLRDRKTIDERLDAVAFLLDHPDFLQQIGSTLTALGSVDIQRLMTFLFAKANNQGTVESTITNLISLRQWVKDASPLLQLSWPKELPTLLSAIQSSLSSFSFSGIETAIHSVLDCELLDKTHSVRRGKADNLGEIEQCFAVKSGLNAFLDIARQRYSSSIESMFELSDRIKDKLGIPVKLLLHPRRPAELSVPLCHQRLLDPQVFLDQTVSGKNITCTTAELTALSVAHQEALSESLKCQALIVEFVLEEIRAHIGQLYSITELVGMLDLLQSFAAFALRQDCRRPLLTQGQNLQISAGRLPTALGSAWPPIDVKFEEPSAGLLLVSGPNAAGKTSTLVLCGQLAFLCHCGSFVPAESLQFSPLDRIAAILPSHTAPDTAQSTFSKEIQLTSQLLQRATRNSLLLLDEFGRGTNHTEGAALAWALAEYLLDLRAQAIITTHFPQLLTFQLQTVGVKHIRCEGKGSSNPSPRHYGLAIAETVGMPSSIIVASKLKHARLHSVNDTLQKLTTFAELDDQQLKALLGLDDEG